MAGTSGDGVVGDDGRSQVDIDAIGQAVADGTIGDREAAGRGVDADASVEACEVSSLSGIPYLHVVEKVGGTAGLESESVPLSRRAGRCPVVVGVLSIRSVVRKRREDDRESCSPIGDFLAESSSEALIRSRSVCEWNLLE